MQTCSLVSLSLQDAKFSAQVASLEAEVRSLKGENAALSKDNKTCYSQLRAKDKQLDSAAKEVEQARQTELHNKVGQAGIDSKSIVTVVRQTNVDGDNEQHDKGGGAGSSN